jgi:shikimate dehydrogenase
MKNYLVIGNPIEHSLSPRLHNYWIKDNNIKAIYEKKKLDENEIENLIIEIREQKINGVNVTVPFKKKVINYLDDLSLKLKKLNQLIQFILKITKLLGTIQI